MPELVASLPVVGVDGTLRRRGKGADYMGQAHIKGGTLAGVRAIAGYLLDAGGRRIALVCLINHPAVTNANAQPVCDALLAWSYSNAGR